jgi:hypothetical protein
MAIGKPKAFTARCRLRLFTLLPLLRHPIQMNRADFLTRWLSFNMSLASASRLLPIRSALINLARHKHKEQVAIAYVPYIDKSF